MRVCVAGWWAAVALVGCAGAPVDGQTFIWIGGADPDRNGWQVRANWSPDDGIPGQEPFVGADVIVPEASPQCTGNTVVEIGSLTANGSMQIQVSTFTIQGPALFNDLTLATASGSTPQIVLGSTAELAGPTTWQHADFVGAGPVTVSGGMSLVPSGGSKTKQLDGVEMIANAPVSQSGTLELLNGGKLTNNSTWTIANTDIAPDFIGAMGSLENTGTIEAVGEEGDEAFISVPVTSESGHFRAKDGAALHLVGGGAYSGGLLEVVPPDDLEAFPTLELHGAGILDEATVISGGVDAFGTGTFLLTGNEIRIEPGAALSMAVESALISEGAVIWCNGQLVNENKCRWENGTLVDSVASEANGLLNFGSLDIAQGGGFSEHSLGTRLRNTSGAEVEQSDALSIELTGVVENEGGATWEVQGQALAPGKTGRGEFINEGRLELFTGSIEVDFVQRQGGETVVPIGQSTLAWSSEWGPGNSSFEIGDGATLAVADRVEVVSGTHTIAGSGTLELDVPLDDPRAMEIAPGALVVNDALFRFEGETMAGGDTAFINEGGFEWLEGTIAMGAPGGVGFVNNGFLGIGGLAGTLDTKTLTGSLVNFAFGGAGNVTQVGGPLELVGAEIVNEGDWFLDQTVGIPMDAGSVFVNEFAGVLRSIDGAPGSGLTRLDNPGTVVVESGFLGIEEIVQIQEGVLTGGAWFVAPGATLVTPAFDTIGAGAFVASGEAWEALSGVEAIRGGTLEANGDIAFEGPTLDVLDGGDVIIGPVDAFVPDATNVGAPDDPETPEDESSILDELETSLALALGVSEPTLTTPVLNVWAKLVPGRHDESGPLHLVGDLEMHETGRVLVDLGGTEPALEYDVVVIDGAATLGGTLEVSLLGGFEPAEGDEFVVLEATSVDGTFDEVVLPDGVGLSVAYTPTQVVLGPCAADFNGDGSLNILDFVAFQGAFLADDPSADCDANGLLNVLDFVCFQDAFQAGCS